jgi:hypothetical protein
VVSALAFGRAYIVQDAGMLATVPAHLRGVTRRTQFDPFGRAVGHALLRSNIPRDGCVAWKGVGVGAENVRRLELFRGPLRP